MSNPLRGEVEFKAGEATYTLRYSTNAICELEDKLNRSIISITGDLIAAERNPDAIRLSTVRAMLWAGLREHHPGITIEDAGEIMTAMGGLVGAIEVISDGFTKAFPQQRDVGASSARPQKPSRPRHGTGLAS